MASVAQPTEQPTDIFWPRVSGMTSGWKKRESLQTVSELSRREGTPLFISINDTVLPKTVPSSKAKRPTQGAGWHYSHLEGKVVYRHQVHAAIVGTGDTSLCYSLKRCCLENGTKIDMTFGNHSLSSESNGGLYPDGQLVHQPRCS